MKKYIYILQERKIMMALLVDGILNGLPTQKIKVINGYQNVMIGILDNVRKLRI